MTATASACASASGKGPKKATLCLTMEQVEVGNGGTGRPVEVATSAAIVASEAGDANGNKPNGVRKHILAKVRNVV